MRQTKSNVTELPDPHMFVKWGLESSRVSILPLARELIFTSDEFNAYLGDGSTAGGRRINNGLKPSKEIYFSQATAKDLEILRVDCRTAPINLTLPKTSEIFKCAILDSYYSCSSSNKIILKTEDTTSKINNQSNEVELSNPGVYVELIFEPETNNWFVGAHNQMNDIDDAPNDGKIYGRKNGQWVEIPSSI